MNSSTSFFSESIKPLVAFEVSITESIESIDFGVLDVGRSGTEAGTVTETGAGTEISVTSVSSVVVVFGTGVEKSIGCVTCAS